MTTSLQFKTIAINSSREPKLTYKRWLSSASEDIVFPSKGEYASPVSDDFYAALQNLLGLAIEWGRLEQDYWYNNATVVSVKITKEGVERHGVAIKAACRESDSLGSWSLVSPSPYIHPDRMTMVDRVNIEALLQFATEYIDEAFKKLEEQKAAEAAMVAEAAKITQLRLVE